ncbi:MAG: hypothetical protein JNL66_12040, partial [Alphaproteobacteria bacterium]|nr:hypothetical protein [Alphaproteobacteria bacterium]
MRLAAIEQALEELGELLPKLDGDERSQIVRVEARLRAALAGRCSEPQGCVGCPGACHLDRVPQARR